MISQKKSQLKLQQVQFSNSVYRVAAETKYDYGHLFRAQGSKFSFSIICLSIVIFPYDTSLASDV